MKATFDGTTVMNIEYSAKEIKPHFCKLTGEMEFDCYFDGRYVGTANSHGAAAAKLDELAYEALTEDASACAGFGCVDGCGDCQAEPSIADQLAAKGMREAHGEQGAYTNVTEHGRITQVWAQAMQVAA